MKKLIFTVGIPASGKSTYAESYLSNTPNCILICPDTIREELTGDITNQTRNKEVFEIAHSRAKTALSNDVTVFCDVTGYNRKNRKDWIKIANNLGAVVEAHVMTTPNEISLDRNQKRARIVPGFVMERMINGYQEPSIEEGIDKIIKV